MDVSREDAAPRTGLEEALKRAILERKEAGESLRKVAERADVSHHAVAKFVNGGGLTLRVAGRLCQALGLSVHREEKVSLGGAGRTPSHGEATGSQAKGSGTHPPTVSLGAEDRRGMGNSRGTSGPGPGAGTSEHAESEPCSGPEVQWTGHLRAEAPSVDEAPSFDEDTEAGDEDEDIEAYEEDEDIEAGDPLDEPDPELEALLQRRREARWLDDWAGWRGGWNYFHHVWMFVDRYNRPLYRLSLAAKGKEREKLDYFVAGVVEFNPQKEAVLSHKGLVEAYQRMVNSIPVKIIFIPLGARIEPGDIDRVLAADALFFPDLLLGLELPRAGEGLSMERRDSPEAGPESDVAEPRTAPVVEPASASEPLGLREQAEGGREISSTKPVEGPPGVQRYDSVEGLLFASWQARYERERLRRRQPPKPPPTSEPPEDDWDEDEELNRRSSGRKIAEAQARKVWVSSRGLSREISKLGDQIDGWVPEPDPGFRALVERYGSGKGSSLDRKRFFCFLEALTLRNPEGAEILAHPRIGDVYRLASPRIDDLIDMKHLGTGLRVGDIEYPDSDSMMADLEPLLARLHGRIRQYTVLGGIRGMGGKEGR